jgi:hypothetical protein
LLEILRIGAARVADDSTCPQVQSVLAKISLCRTHWMGGRKYRCEDCDEISTRYNSCGDRHCPSCSGGKRFDFNEKASKLLLPGVVYYQVVFTLPSQLSELALANRHEMADLLNDTSWQSLSTSIRREQAYQPAGISMLHSWNQQMDAHWHVHLLVPGEGPALDGGGWKRATAPPDSPNSDGYYLVDAGRLRQTYRRRAIRKLRRLRSEGKLKLGGKFAYLQNDENWEAFIRQLESSEWVAYIQPPPAATSRANEVVNYLTRYLTGGPISEHRITAADEHEVTFLAREGTKVGGERQQVPITLSVEEFVRRWCLHIQPEQLTKTRYLGGWSNPCRVAYMSHCLTLLSELHGPDEAASEESAAASSATDEAAPRQICSHCGSDRLLLTEETPRPSWRDLLSATSESCPGWYAQLQREDDRRFWDGLKGEGFNAWYLETVVESAKEPPPLPPPPVQLYLPGLWPGNSFQLQSF